MFHLYCLPPFEIERRFDGIGPPRNTAQLTVYQPVHPVSFATGVIAHGVAGADEKAHLAVGRTPDGPTKRSDSMQLTTEQREQVASEVKRFAADLNLTSDQKEKLQNAFQDARGRLGDYMKDHPSVTRADIAKEVMSHRDQIRQRVVNFLNPDQLKKWDAEIAKAKEFLGQHMA
jgi:hypothetical protein